MNAPTEAFPLSWPTGRPRVPSHRRREAAFKVGFARSRDEMLRELNLLGARAVVLSSNVPLRRNGLPYSDYRQPDDPGVAVYFQRAGKPYVLACDSYRKVEHNMRAVGATVEALRSIARHGASEMLEQAFTGFQALPAPRAAEASWWDVLGVPPDAEHDEIRDRYRALASQHHPDVGGDHERMARINRAYEQASEGR